MNLIVFDFWTIMLLAIGVGGMYILYLFAWQLAYSSEGMIIMLSRMGMHRFAKSLLATLIGYDEQTYQRSRVIVWNQVHVRFFMLWCVILAFTSLGILYSFRPIVWIIRTVSIAETVAEPSPGTDQQSDACVIRSRVNEPLRLARKPAQPLIRRWDYLDELFAEAA